MRREQAFTLIEVLLVIVILVIVISMAAPNFSQGYGALQLRQAADDFTNKARWAQAMAMAHQRSYRLTFAENRQCYSLTRAKDAENTQETVFEGVPGAVGRSQCLPGQTRFSVDVQAMSFYPDGTLDPMEIEIGNDQHKVVLSSQAKRGAIVVMYEE